ncbi:DUF1648 domain-containing protein [Streptomyces nodosus]|uniref:DUF1648 domain-containing protein n=1 Tax=Streptomyces nodosus TaxID=40318 RepID=UPI00381433E6
MSERVRHGGGASWGVAGWSAGILVLLVAIPLAAEGRLPQRLATHWSGAGEPDGSMPLWGAVLVPALCWLVVAVGMVILGRRTDAAREWVAVVLATGFLLVGAQAAIVRANLDRTDWHEARSMSVWLVVGLGVAACAAGLITWLSGRRPGTPREAATDGPVMDLPQGQRLMWFSRATNPWIQGASAATGLATVAAALVAVTGLTGPLWRLIVPLAVTSVVLLGCGSVEARVSEQGLKVAFGPFGLPALRWTLKDIESARSEHRTAAQSGGWGYRLGPRGTTVMLRGGECLVIRARGRDFAVSVDDAERGAALLNTWVAQRASR